MTERPITKTYLECAGAKTRFAASEPLLEDPAFATNAVSRKQSSRLPSIELPFARFK